MITLKIGKPFVLFLTSKTQTERFVAKWQIDNFCQIDSFLLKIKIEWNQSGSWIVFFFKEKVTLKHLKIFRSSNPKVHL